MLDLVFCTTLEGNDGDNEFLTFFKGIKISSANGTNGGLYYINLLNSFSRIRLFYRDTSGVSSEHDTLDFDFNINSNCAYYHKVTHDYTGTWWWRWWCLELTKVSKRF